jgi:hypothetical protein
MTDQKQLHAVALYNLIAVPGDIRDQAKAAVSHNDQPQRHLLDHILARVMHPAAAAAATTMIMRTRSMFVAAFLKISLFFEDVPQLFDSLRGHPKHRNSFRSHQLAEHEQ